jgi:hypothetical protein
MLPVRIRSHRYRLKPVKFFLPILVWKGFFWIFFFENSPPIPGESSMSSTHSLQRSCSGTYVFEGLSDRVQHSSFCDFSILVLYWTDLLCFVLSQMMTGICPTRGSSRQSNPCCHRVWQVYWKRIGWVDNFYIRKQEYMNKKDLLRSFFLTPVEGRRDRWLDRWGGYPLDWSQLTKLVRVSEWIPWLIWRAQDRVVFGGGIFALTGFVGSDSWGGDRIL